MPGKKGLDEQTEGGVLATPLFYLQKGLQTRQHQQTSVSSFADEEKWTSSVRTQGGRVFGWGRGGSHITWRTHTPLLGFAPHRDPGRLAHIFATNTGATLKPTKAARCG